VLVTLGLQLEHWNERSRHTGFLFEAQRSRLVGGGSSVLAEIINRAGWTSSRRWEELPGDRRGVFSLKFCADQREVGGVGEKTQEAIHVCVMRQTFATRGAECASEGIQRTAVGASGGTVSGGGRRAEVLSRAKEQEQRSQGDGFLSTFAPLLITATSARTRACG
jgi:hypothetical protein